MKHRTIEYDVREIEPGRWRWSISPGSRIVQGLDEYRSRERAVEACIGEINNGIERSRTRNVWAARQSKTAQGAEGWLYWHRDGYGERGIKQP